MPYSLLKRAQNAALKVAYQVFQGRAPVKNNRIVFMSVPDASDNAWHLYRYMLQKVSGYEFIWLCEEVAGVKPRIMELASMRGTNSVFVRRLRSLSGAYFFSSSAYAFCTQGPGVFLFGRKGSTPIIVNLWHGMPIKPIGWMHKKIDSVLRAYQCHYTLSTSPLFTNIIEKSFDPDAQTLEFGLPRNDALLSGCTQVRNKIFGKLNLSEKCGLIFWLPTFRHSRAKSGKQSHDGDAQNGSFLEEWPEHLLSELDSAAGKAGNVVIIKLHPQDQLNSKCLTGKYPYIKVLSSERWQELGLDLYEALSISTALISDVSSVLVDYIATGQPLAVTANSRDTYTRGVNAQTQALLGACHQITDMSSLLAFVADPATAGWDPETLAWYHSTADGRACERITNYFFSGAK